MNNVEIHGEKIYSNYFKVSIQIHNAKTYNLLTKKSFSLVFHNQIAAKNEII